MTIDTMRKLMDALEAQGATGETRLVAIVGGLGMHPFGSGAVLTDPKGNMVCGVQVGSFSAPEPKDKGDDKTGIVKPKAGEVIQFNRKGE